MSSDMQSMILLSAAIDEAQLSRLERRVRSVITGVLRRTRSLDGLVVAHCFSGALSHSFSHSWQKILYLFYRFLLSSFGKWDREALVGNRSTFFDPFFWVALSRFSLPPRQCHFTIDPIE